MRAIVIGGGHNGLTAAVLLAKGGMQVTVLEARDELGGLAARCSFGDGKYSAPGLLHDTRGVREGIVDALGLERHGLRRRKALRICAPSAEGEPIWLEGNAIDGAVNDKDRKGHEKLRGFIDRVTPVLRDLMNRPPPDPAGEVWPLLVTGVRVRTLGAADMLELLRVAPTSIADWMRDSYDSERLRAAIALPAVQGEFAGVWSSGTAAALLFAEATAAPEIEGGPAALVDALVAAAESQKIELRTGARVRRIRIEDGVARGVALEDGEDLDADVVLSTIDPRSCFLDLVGAQRLPLALAGDIKNVRGRGTTAKLHLALDAPLAVRDGSEVEALRSGETLDDIERAFDPVKYRDFARHPVLDVRVSSADDHHVVSAMVHFAAFDLAGGWTDAARDELGEAAIAALERCCPKVRDHIVAQEVLTPADIAARYGIRQGNVFHAEHALDQLLFMRPTVDTARYATPVRGLFLGGSGSHPGGGITCAPGALAARAIVGG